jgi:hypothetical protein
MNYTIPNCGKLCAKSLSNASLINLVNLHSFTDIRCPVFHPVHGSQAAESIRIIP